MWSPQIAALLLLFAVISIPGDAVKFPFIFGGVSECIQNQCSRKINACQERHGAALTGELKGCIAKSCKQDMISCMDWIIKEVVAAREHEYPQIPIADLLEAVMKEIVDSYFHCFRHSDHQNMTQFLGDFLEHLLVKAEPYTDLISSLLGISKTGLISCWLKKALRPALSCYNHADKNFYTMLENNMEREMTFNMHEYIRCSNNMLKDKSCFQMHSRIYGSTPAMLRQSKDIFICFINELLIATTAC